MISRKRYWIQPDFQFRMIRQWIFLVILTTVASNLITLAFIWHQDRKTTGKLVLLNEPGENYTVVVDPPRLKYLDIIFRPLMLALGICCFLSIGAGVFYSHRLAGPIYRIRKTLREAGEGGPALPIVLRKNDEFKELAEDVNVILERIQGGSSDAKLP